MLSVHSISINQSADDFQVDASVYMRTDLRQHVQGTDKKRGLEEALKRTPGLGEISKRARVPVSDCRHFIKKNIKKKYRKHSLITVGYYHHEMICTSGVGAFLISPSTELMQEGHAVGSL